MATADAFRWTERSQLPDTPWLVFCCPPYRFFNERRDELLELTGRLLRQAPAASTLVVESDLTFDHALLPAADSCRTREYPPARVSVLDKE